MAEAKPQHRAYSRDMEGVLIELKYGGLVSCSCCDMEFKEKKSQEYADIIESTIQQQAATIERMRGLLQGLMDAGVLSENMMTMTITISEAMFAEINQALDTKEEK